MPLPTPIHTPTWGFGEQRQADTSETAATVMFATEQVPVSFLHAAVVSDHQSNSAFPAFAAGFPSILPNWKGQEEPAPCTAVWNRNAPLCREYLDKNLLLVQWKFNSLMVKIIWCKKSHIGKPATANAFSLCYDHRCLEVFARRKSLRYMVGIWFSF